MPWVAGFMYLLRKQCARTVLLATLRQDDGKHDTRWAACAHVLRSVIPFIQDLIPSRKAVEKRKPFQLETTSDIIGHSGIGPCVPPDTRFLHGLTKTGAHATVVILNPRLGLPSTVSCNLRYIDAEIHCE